MVLAESLLHRVQRAVRLGEALNGGDGGPFALERQSRTGLGRDAVDVNDAGAALRSVAADMRAGEPQVLAQELHQQRALFDVAVDRLSVHRHGDRRHDFLLISGSKPLISPYLGKAPGRSGFKSSRFWPVGPWNWNNFEPQPHARSRDSSGRGGLRHC
jgi:hypothetical protein